MEKFIKFANQVNIRGLSEEIQDERIIILRESKTTGTIQVKVIGQLSNRELKNIFKPHHIKKIYDEFPYPLHGKRLPIIKSIKDLFKFNSVSQTK